ncbi:MAG TPA: phage tail protein, partial [Gammaproteobacteria bacterium]|nr:phage tail protein [Gammaproteobacteria bacterium]
MPEYLAPGVYVEEVSFRSKSIEGVGTSVAGIVGPTRFGPVRGKPEVVTSFAEFTRLYGDVGDLTLGPDTVLNHTAMAAKAFFDGGGKQLFVSRIANFGGAEDGL